MSRHADALARSRDVIGRVLTEIPQGTTARARKVRRFDLAVQHAEDWAADRPPKSGQRGGSSSPREVSDRLEEAGVKRLAALAVSRLASHALAVAKLVDEIERDVTFLTAITDEVPTETLPGCRSCARVDAFEPVDTVAGLCKWCADYGQGQSPPEVLVALRHRGTRRDLSRWLSKNMPERSQAAVRAPVPPSCGSSYTSMAAGVVYCCHRPQGHDGVCRGVLNGEMAEWSTA